MNKSKNILITGATGNVGYETVRALQTQSKDHQIIGGTVNPDKAKKKFSGFDNIIFRKLDFTDSTTFEEALDEIGIVFLLRPPQLADVSKYFEPFVDAMIRKNIQNIVFLSVQGAENKKTIPHHKIENLIRSKDLEYVFLRPGYFMQNLTTTLIHEIKTKNKIFIPGGNVKFQWVDARDIGLVAAHVLVDPDSYKNEALEITGSEFIGFQEVADLLTEKIGRTIEYESPNLLKFYVAKRRQGVSNAMILVMIMLHFLPRFQKNEPWFTETVNSITGHDPNILNQFIEREIHKFI